MTSGSADDGARGPELQRAEELLDQMVDAAGTCAAQASFWIMKRVARSREEIEDIWTEAQSLSRQDQR